MAIREFLAQNKGYHAFTEKGVAANRMGKFKILFPDLEGTEGLKVKYCLKRHDFDFGCNLFMLEQYETAEENDRYLTLWKKLFNTAVVPVYWEGTEPQQGLLRYDDHNGVNMYRRPPARKVVDYCKANNIAPKGHPLFWHEFIPSWLPKNWNELFPLIEKRFAEISELFAEDIPVFDVVNEPSRIWDMTFEHASDGYTMLNPPEDYLEQLLTLGKKYFPNNQLILNDAVSASFMDFRGIYGGYYQLHKRLIGEGYKIDKIGLQCHTADMEQFKNVFVADRLNSLLNTYGSLGKEVVISEISIESGIGEDAQAEAVEMLYRVAFSNPHVSGIFWWNLDDNGVTTFQNRDAVGENLPTSGLVRNGMPKESYRILDRLINQEWHTEGEAQINGELEFEGFYGNYDLELEVNGKVCRKQISLGKNDPREIQVIL